MSIKALFKMQIFILFLTKVSRALALHRLQIDLFILTPRNPSTSVDTFMTISEKKETLTWNLVRWLKCSELLTMGLKFELFNKKKLKLSIKIVYRQFNSMSYRSDLPARINLNSANNL